MYFYLLNYLDIKNTPVASGDSWFVCKICVIFSKENWPSIAEPEIESNEISSLDVG